MSGGNPAWGARPFHSNSKPIPFYLGPSGNFSRAVWERFWQQLQRFLSVPLSSSAFISFPDISCHNRLFETVSADYLKTDLFHTCFNSLWWISRTDWMRNLSFKITLPSSLSGSISVYLRKAYLSLSRNLSGPSFSFCSMLASLS